MGGISFTLQRGSFLLFAVALLLAAAAAAWAYRRTMPPVPVGARRLLGLLRFGAYGVILLVLFDPLVTFESVLTIRPSVAVLVDRSSSMGIEDGNPAAGGKTVRRIEAAERILGGEDEGLLETLERRYDVSLHSFAGGLVDAAGAEGGDATDIARALEETMEAEWERGVDAFVLLSDGIVTAGRDPVRAAGELGAAVYAVPVGDPTPPRDIALEQVLSNRLVYVNSRVAVEATVRAKGFAGEEATVRVLDGEAVVAEERVRFEERRETRTLTLGFPVHEEGVKRYRVEVPVAEGELVEENNRILFTVEAVKEKLGLLVYADRPGWDFAFLRRVLERDPNVEARFFVQGRDGSPEDVGDPGGGSGFPFDREDLFRYDLVIVMGQPAALSRDFGATLAEFVRVRGGALFLLATDPMASPYPESIAEIAPVRMERRRPDFDSAPFPIKLTDRGRRHPMLRLHQDPEESEREWAELPPLAGAHRLGPAKPSAEVLAVHPRLRADGEDVPILALAAAGKGRVLFGNGAGMWRWDFRMWGVGKSNETYERFWSNAVRWLVSRGGYQNVTVRPENMTYNRGETVTFRGLAMDGSLAPVPDARVEVTLRRPEGEEEKFILEPNPAEPGAYRRTVGPFPPGDYAYEASVVRGSAPIGEDRGEFSVGDFSAEFLETETDLPLLRSLARATGGAVIAADSVGEWDGDLSLPSRSRRILDEREIWNHWVLFLLVLALLSTEWWLRKRRGLS
ncbi:MAG: hypothetical protein ABIK65_13455 [Candidatus Eisenbacteria bacterium]